MKDTAPGDTGEQLPQSAALTGLLQPLVPARNSAEEEEAGLCDLVPLRVSPPVVELLERTKGGTPDHEIRLAERGAAAPDNCKRLADCLICGDALRCTPASSFVFVRGQGDDDTLPKLRRRGEDEGEEDVFNCPGES